IGNDRDDLKRHETPRKVMVAKTTLTEESHAHADCRACGVTVQLSGAAAGCSFARANTAHAELHRRLVSVPEQTQDVECPDALVADVAPRRIRAGGFLPRQRVGRRRFASRAPQGSVAAERAPAT